MNERLGSRRGKHDTPHTLLAIYRHRRRGVGDGELAGEPAQQVGRHDGEQAIQPLRPDQQDRRPDLKQDVSITYFDKTENFPRAKDLLDRYDALSTKLRVDYVDPDKKPQVARAAGMRNYGAITIDAGPRHEEAKSLTEEEVTGAVIRTLKGGERTVCSVSGSGEHTFDDTGRGGYSALKDSFSNATTIKRARSLCSRKPEVPKDCTVLLSVARASTTCSRW